MNKRFTKVCSLLLALVLALSLTLPALAAESDTVHLSSPEDLVQLAEDCLLDSYSLGLTVILDRDMDMTGVDFQGIPSFSGTFSGNHHAIRGLNLTEQGSVKGFIRYLKAPGLVENLTVEGTFAPEGSAGTLGGIAGSNEGTIRYCTVKGSVSGSDWVGGIAGRNRVTGTIDECHMYGTLEGRHFAGGIAGENAGVIRRCNNSALINTKPMEESTDLSHISIGTITGTEAAATVTDVGGITGSSLGVIRDCLNYGPVGYPHTGYNVGGITGSHKGYMTGCTNYAEVWGRKEVGGIAGQMEPVSQVEFNPDTLQILQGQMNTASDLLSQASQENRQNMDAIQNQLGAMDRHAQNAQQAMDVLIVKPGEPIPDLDELLAAKNALSGSMKGMQDSMQGLASSAQSAGQHMTQSVNAMANQMHVIAGTIQGGTENLGFTVTDVSDQDTEEDLTGKIELCTNYGAVDGDLNVGGIAGAMSIENDLDPEDDLFLTGNASLNFKGELRSVLLSCRNHGAVTCKKRSAGGVVGWHSLGLVKNCVNSGDVTGSKADYVGGIAGTSTGWIRQCSSKSRLTGGSFVGGVAGSATRVTDCRSLSALDTDGENIGAVIGLPEDITSRQETEIRGNLYLTGLPDRGGIDGVSYEGVAQSMDTDSFLALEGLPPIFGTSTVTFLEENGVNLSLKVPLGGSLEKDEIPEVPRRENYTGVWEGLTDEQLEHIYFDRVYKVRYTPYQVTIQSETVRQDGLPVMLVQGKFQDMDRFPLTEFTDYPELPKYERGVGGWLLPAFSDRESVQVRVACPQGQDIRFLTVYVENKDGQWRQEETEYHGSYLGFTAEPGDQAISIVYVPDSPHWFLYLLCLVVFVGFVIFFVHHNRKHRKSEKKPKTKKKK